MSTKDSDTDSNRDLMTIYKNELDVSPPKTKKEIVKDRLLEAQRITRKFLRFIGPGFMVAVAYIDPGNYSTDASAGAETRFGLLFMVLFSTIIAVFFQILCVRLGSVSGGTLAENCREYMPRWMYLTMYVISEAAIISTDLAEAIGTAIALNLLFKINLLGCIALTILDVIFVLIFYRPQGAAQSFKWFEYFVAALVLIVVVSFCVELSFIKNASASDIFKGYLPSDALWKGQGLFLACGILGATVMPHSLFLGTLLCQSRLREVDVKAGREVPERSTDEFRYKPSFEAIKSTMSYSIVELVIQLSVFALFVNSAILIVSGASFFNNPDAGDADLFGIYGLLKANIGIAAATIFALALLMSGLSAGLVATVASQITTEGMLQIYMKPYVMRLITRTISIVISLIVAAKGGASALGDALNWSQVILSLCLPFITLPLVWFSSKTKYMTVTAERIAASAKVGDAVEAKDIDMKADIVTASISWILWGFVAFMNGALIILTAMGKA